MTFRHRSAVVLGVAAIAVSAQAQSTAPPRAGLIAGVVTTADGQATPVRRAVMTLSGSGIAGSVQTATDDAGRFVFSDLPSGRFVLTAEKPGFVKTFYGSPRVGRGPSMPLALPDGGRIDDLRIALVRGAVIAGAVVDELGKPIASAQVHPLQVAIVNGERRFVDPPGSQQFITTDERGRYRLYGLPPGEYVVRCAGGGGVSTGEVHLTTAEMLILNTAPAAAPKEPPQVTRGTVYAPGAVDAADAQTITLTAGDERTGVDIRSPLVRSVRVEGLAAALGGQPVPNINVGIANASTGSLWASPGIVRSRPDGHWQLPTMPAGRYVFFGRGSLTSAGTNVPLDLWTETEVIVGEQDVTNVVLVFQPGTTVAGRLLFRGQAAAPDVAGLRVVLTQVPRPSSAAVMIAPGTPLPDGSFSFTGVPPARYRLSVTGAGAWMPRSAIVNGRDVLDAPLEVPQGQDVRDIPLLFTDQPTELSGVLLDQAGRPAPEYAVIVLSASRDDWITAPRRISGIVRLTQDGRFSVIGLPPGDYVLAALTDLDPNQLSDLSLLERLAQSGVRVTLGEGEKKVQNVRLGGG